MMKAIHRVMALALVGCLTFAFPGVALCEEYYPVYKNSNADIELTLDQAADMALAKSHTVKIADYDIERSQEVRDRADLDSDYTPTGPTTVAASAAFTAVVASDVSLQMSKKTKEVAADGVVMSVFQYYTGILDAQEKVTAAEKALANARWQQMVAQVGYDVGTVSLSAKTTAEANYLNKEAALEAARTGLVDSYQKLNSLVGLNPEDRPILKDDPQMVPLKIDNLESEVNRRLEVSPSIWLKDQQAELAKLNLDLWSSSPTEPYKVKEIDVTKAEISAADSREQMEQLVRNLYQSIRQMEEQYVSLEQTLKIAEENLRIKQVQFEVGMATKGDVLAAENDAASARQALKSLAYQHEVLKLAFDKPWAYSGP